MKSPRLLALVSCLCLASCGGPPIETYFFENTYVGELHPVKLLVDGAEIGVLKDLEPVEWRGRLRTPGTPENPQVLSAQWLRPDGWEACEASLLAMSDPAPGQPVSVSLDIPFGREPFIKLYVDNREGPEAALRIGEIQCRVPADRTATIYFLAPRAAASAVVRLNGAEIGSVKRREELLDPKNPDFPHTPASYVVDTSGRRKYRLAVRYYGIGDSPPPITFSRERLHYFGEPEIVDFLEYAPSMDRIGSRTEITQVR